MEGRTSGLDQELREPSIEHAAEFSKTVSLSARGFRLANDASRMRKASAEACRLWLRPKTKNQRQAISVVV